MNGQRVIWRRDRVSGGYKRQFMEHPEKTLVEGLQNLQVLAVYDFQKMDELVKDLTNALEDTTGPSSPNRAGKNAKSASGQKNCCPNSVQQLNVTPCSTMKKRRSKRRRPNTHEASTSLQAGNISEASESSLDEALRDYLENISQNQSDSDHDVVFNTQRLQNITCALPQVAAFAESDSLAENISPMRPQRRRKRQFIKKMAIDPLPSDSQPSACGELGMDSEVNLQASDTKPGKRKWCMKDKSAQNSFDMGIAGDERSHGSSEHNDPDSQSETASMSESSSSAVSSGESDGLYTNDEARDGDDEHSDFFHEPGPTCGIPGIVPWWEADKPSSSSLLRGSLASDRDPNFESILTGSFQHMSDSTKRSFKARLKMLGKSEREIRAGRRRLKERLPGYTLSTFLKDRQKWSDTSGGRYAWPQPGNGSGRTSNGVELFKRPRKAPPPAATEDMVHGEYVGGNADPIPDSNIGSRLLQSMGWTPGSGLGVDGSGMVNPLVAYKRRGRKGLGTRIPKMPSPGQSTATATHPGDACLLSTHSTTSKNT